jgi:hypothetical protein
MFGLIQNKRKVGKRRARRVQGLDEVIEEEL